MTASSSGPGDPVVEFVDDPAELTGGRIGQWVGDRLRPGCVHLEVAVAIAQELLDPLQPLRLDIAERRQLGLVDLAERDEADRRGVEVDADDVLGVDVAEFGRQHRAEVAALGAVAVVAEPAHQLGPGRGSAGSRPAGLG